MQSDVPCLHRGPFLTPTNWALYKDFGTFQYCEVNVIRVLEKISNLLNKWFIWIGGVALLIMMGIACANMLLRPLGAPLKGAYELAGFLGALTIALPLGYAQITRSHIAVDILATQYSKRAQRIMYAYQLFFVHDLLRFGRLASSCLCNHHLEER